MTLKRRLLATLTCILAALVLLAGMAGQALAEDASSDAVSNRGSITITNAAPGKTYNVYKVFDLTMHKNGETVDSYAYTISSNSNLAWYRFFSAGAGKDYVTLTPDASDNTLFAVAWKDGQTKPNGETTEAFNKAMYEYISDNSELFTTAAATQTNSSSGESQLTFSGLPFGYYLVTSNMGALISLDSTTPTVEVQEKNTRPTLSKFVEEGGAWGSKNDAAIGDKVTFRLVIDAKYGASNFVVKDTLSEGFTFDKQSVKVWTFVNQDSSATASSIVANSNNFVDDYLVDAVDTTYSVGDASASNTFEVFFVNEWLSSLENNSWIVIEYVATVNSNAVIATNQTSETAMNTNVAVLNYGVNQGTTEQKTITHVWSLPVYKFYTEGADDVTERPLSGAIFSLSKIGAGNVSVKLNFVQDGGGETEVYRLALGDESGCLTEFNTPVSGKLTFKGLDSGEYILTEIKAPDGFNKLTKPVEITVDNDGAIKVKITENSTVTEKTVDTVEVENKAGTELPSTGGMGTTVIYIVGGVLVAAAVVLLVAKKKVSSSRK